MHSAVIAITAMALASYLTRLGGPWLLARLPPSPRRDRFLRPLPGTILAAIVAPAALGHGLPGVLAAGIAVTVAVRRRSLPAAVVSGTAAFLALSAFR